jgi:hypothetical protein
MGREELNTSKLMGDGIHENSSKEQLCPFGADGGKRKFPKRNQKHFRKSLVFGIFWA